jgi:hypothetical protein
MKAMILAIRERIWTHPPIPLPEGGGDWSGFAPGANQVD